MSDETASSERQSAEIVNLDKVRKEIERRLRHSKNAERELVERMNKRFAAVNEGDEYRVYCENRDPLTAGRWRTTRLRFHAFRERFMHKRLEVEVEDPKRPGHTKKIYRSYAEIWLNSEDRRQCDGGPVFDPTGKISSGNYWNLWKGFGVKPVKNRQGWKLMQDHIFHVLVGGVREHEQYLLNSAARLVQHPELPGEVAIVFKGDEGVGKGIYVQALLKIMGQHGLALQHQDHIRGRFNAHLHDCVLLYIDEAFYAGDRQFEGFLKGLITEHDIAIEPKNKNLFRSRNYLHIYMSSNHDWVIPAGLKSRRFFPLAVSDARRRDFAYFRALAHELDNGGAEAMLWDLLHRDITCFDPREIPPTDELKTQQLLTLDVLPRWWMNVLDRGFVYRSKHGAPSLGVWHRFHTNQLLYGSHTQWSADTRWGHPATQQALGRFLHQLYPQAQARGRPEPIGEIEHVERPGWTGHPGSLDPRQGDLPTLDAHSEEAAPVVTDWREAAVIRKLDKHGYQHGDLDEARARFKEQIGDLPMPWDPCD
jgi:hypothetical protein